MDKKSIVILLDHASGLRYKDCAERWGVSRQAAHQTRMKALRELGLSVRSTPEELKAAIHAHSIKERLLKNDYASRNTPEGFYYKELLPNVSISQGEFK